MSSGKLDGLVSVVIWLHKSSANQHWELLLVWHDTVILLNVVSSSSHSLESAQQYLLQALMSVTVLSQRPCGKINGRITSPLFATHPNTIIWTGCLVFINMNMSLSSNWQSDTQIFAVKIMQYSMSFSNIWMNEMHQGAAFHSDCAQLILVCCRVDKSWNKLITCTKLIT